jgi:hypothetical protein
VSQRLRRLLVIAGVAISLVFGLVSIQIAAALTIAAAPPPAPPISMTSLQAALQAEQARAIALQEELATLLGSTAQLTSAIDSTDARLTADGASATDLRARLKAAQARLALLTKLLKKASDRLAALGAAGPTVPPGPGGGGTPSKPTPKPTAHPTARPTAPPGGFALALSLSGGSVVADWTACAPSGFSGYALVRSTDSEIHYPPEDRDTEVTTVPAGGGTRATDANAPSGKVWYRAYCLTVHDHETKVAAATNTASVVVP